MYTMKLTRIPLTAFVSGLGKPITLSAPKRAPCLLLRAERYSTQGGRSSTLRKLKRATLRDRVMAPAGDTGGKYLNVVTLNSCIHLHTTMPLKKDIAVSGSVNGMLACNIPIIQSFV